MGENKIETFLKPNFQLSVSSDLPWHLGGPAVALDRWALATASNTLDLALSKDCIGRVWGAVNIISYTRECTHQWERLPNENVEILLL